MNKQELQNWISELKGKVPVFLNEMKSEEKAGFYRYSYSGDLFNEDSFWGLGNTVFALKIYWTLNIIPDDLGESVKFIQSFQKENGEFTDPLIEKKSFWLRLAASIKNLDFNNIANQQTRRAETRQSISALKLFDNNIKFMYLDFPKDKEGVEKYLLSLDWAKPWGAGSHFSHLLFFLAVSDLENKSELIDFVMSWVNNIQKEDGSWYTGSPFLQQKINGAMKVLTGIQAVKKFGGYNLHISNTKHLVDLVLSAVNNEHACDNFNIVYVLKHCSEMLNNEYRYEEIAEFMKKRLDIYKEFYYPELGGFSFLPSGANMTYYGAKITQGKKEPDIHGTVLFLWGIAVIAEFFEIDKEVGMREFTT